MVALPAASSRPRLVTMDSEHSLLAAADYSRRFELPSASVPLLPENLPAPVPPVWVRGF